MHASRTQPIAVHTELLLLGGGHSHVAVIRQFGMHPLPGVRVTVISRDAQTPYSGMLPGLVAGHYTMADCHIDLRRLCEANGVRLIHASVTALDRAARRVHLLGRPAIAFDWLSVNTGSRPALDSIPGALQYGSAVKPIDRFLDDWQQTLARFQTNPRPFRVLVVGGGAAGVEIALACHTRVKREMGNQATLFTIDLLCAGARLLDTHNTRVQRYFSRLLHERGIGVSLGRRVTRAHADHVELDDGSTRHTDALVWAIHAGAPEWPKASGIACDAAGFIRVNAHLQSISDARVFAAGDIAALPQAVAKSGVYAVREGGILALNLQRAMQGQALSRYRPQRRFLSLLSTGPKHAVVSRGPLFAAGRWVWRWKDAIDRAFMQRYRIPDDRPVPDPGVESLRCGGCAAKVGADVLGRVLANLEGVRREGVETGLEAADDAAVITPPPGQQLVQTVDYFRAFLDDPFLLGRIAAVHAIGDLIAMGARPHSALAIATVPHATTAVMEETLQQLMRGALQTLNSENVSLVGGHSNEGAELAFGLCVNGFAAPDQLLYRSALAAGQALILCKALGHGTLLAANMQAACEAGWLDGVITNMLLGPSRSLQILREYGARACTDVTGFGLLGHLLEMLRASGIGARLDLDAIPVLPGAMQCIEKGYLSSLQQSNSLHLAALTVKDSRHSLARKNLLLDPQTAGGLLAGIPLQHATACVTALREAGYADAVVIGCTDASVAAGCVLA